MVNTANNNCVLCINPKSKTIKIFGRRGRSLNIPEIISKHFWFSVQKSNEFHKEICIHCWRKTKMFHQFYNDVQKCHSNVVEANRNSVGMQNDSEDVKPDVALEIGGYEMNMSDSVAGHFLEAFVGIKSECVEDSAVVSDKDFDISVENLNAFPESNFDNFLSIKSEHVTETETRPLAENVKADDEAEKEADESELESKVSDYFVMNCDLCSAPFQSLNDIQTHFRNEHNNQRGFLRCCNKKINMRFAVIEHIKWHMNPNAFKCTICLKTFNDSRRLAAHNVTYHSEDEKLTFKCQLCDKRFPKKHLLNEHVNRLHPPADQSFACGTCLKEYKTKKLLRNHIQTVHNEKETKHICDICAKVMSSKQALKDHLQTHNEYERIQCNECGAWLKNQATLSKHKKAHTDKEETCTICFKVAPNHCAMLNHKRRVHALAKYKCTFCEKSFRKSLSLKEHVATHTGEILYTCLYCPTTFKSIANKFKHWRQVHADEWLSRKQLRKGNVENSIL